MKNIAQIISDYFHFSDFNTNYKNEAIGGLTTFLTMAYIIIVNPKILEAAGMPFGASVTATILTAAFGTFTLGIYSNRPIAIAPYMGENAFIAFTVVKVLGYSWQTALGAIFIGGCLFVIITLLNIRTWLANSIPEVMKVSFAVGIGLFLTFIGLNETGIVSLGVAGAPVHLGKLNDFTVLLAVLGFIIISILLLKGIKGAILIGILIITIISLMIGNVKIPNSIINMPPDISPVLFKLDILAALNWGFFAVILTVFVMDFLDTLGTLIGIGYSADILDEKGNFPQIEKPMLIDALSTVLAAILGTTTAGCYIESAAGIKAGAKTGFASVITALFFLLSLFLAPVFGLIPPYAYGPAIIIVGMLMISPVTRINFNDFSEVIPAFTIIVLMSFTYNIGVGMTAGFVVYPLVKIFSGKYQDINPGLWFLFVLSLLFYIFFPY